ncbi:hypothetical protein BDZ89DRAFT_299206 [Hymenopellis radicata]|nr:hypothetical protein BDZ89DRAFT_299206 [Hymenopellis radicata]
MHRINRPRRELSLVEAAENAPSSRVAFQRLSALLREKLARMSVARNTSEPIRQRQGSSQSRRTVSSGAPNEPRSRSPRTRQFPSREPSPRPAVSVGNLLARILHPSHRHSRPHRRIPILRPPICFVLHHFALLHRSSPLPRIAAPGW